MKKIKTYATGLFLILAGLLSSCIENNVPYPIIKLDITALEVEGGNHRSGYQYGEPYSDSDPCRYRKYEESIYQESGNDGRCKKHLTPGHDFRPDQSSNGYPVPLSGLPVENHSQTAD